MRLLWLGDAGCTTGFGRVTHAIGDRLVEQYGHEVHVLAVNWRGDWVPTQMRLYLANQKVPTDVYGQSRFVEMLSLVMPDVVVILNDPYVILRFLFRNRWDEDYYLARTFPILAYTPVDGTNIPPTWKMLPKLVADLPPVEGGTGPSFTQAVMSRFGQREFPDAHLVYHGVEVEKFRPPSDRAPLRTSTGIEIRSKADAKAAFGIPKDAFLVLRVDRNSHRKNFGDTWRALVPIMKRDKSVWAWFHCKAEGDQLELPQLISREPDIAERIRFPGQFSTHRGWPEEDLIALYAAADLFVSTSLGEGFGLTLAEAAAMQVPIVAQNVSSIPEVVGPGAVLIEPERLIAVDSGEDQWLPNVRLFSEAIAELRDSRGRRRELGERGRMHVSQFTWDDAAASFDALLKTIKEQRHG